MENPDLYWKLFLPLFSDLKILKLGDIHQLYISSFVFECHNDILLLVISKTFFRPIFSIHSYNTQGATRGDFSLLEKTHYNMQGQIGTYNFVVPGLSQPLF